MADEDENKNDDFMDFPSASNSKRKDIAGGGEEDDDLILDSDAHFDLEGGDDDDLDTSLFGNDSLGSDDY